jgi:hypothetical protein
MHTTIRLRVTMIRLLGKSCLDRATLRYAYADAKSFVEIPVIAEIDDVGKVPRAAALSRDAIAGSVGGR